MAETSLTVSKRGYGHGVIERIAGTERIGPVDVPADVSVVFHTSYLVGWFQGFEGRPFVHPAGR